MSFRSLPQNTKDALDEINRKYSRILQEYGFYLAGGTALALQYDHRISYDLDFFSQKAFDPAELLAQFARMGVENTETSTGTVKFYYNNCQVSFFYYPYEVLQTFVELENYAVDLASPLDIGLMKITAIADRSQKKDFYDLYCIAQKYEGLQRIVQEFKVKYPQANLYHYLKALSYFEDADASPEPNLLEDIGWDQVKEYLKGELKTIL